MPLSLVFLLVVVVVVGGNVLSSGSRNDDGVCSFLEKDWSSRKHLFGASCQM